MSMRIICGGGVEGVGPVFDWLQFVVYIYSKTYILKYSGRVGVENGRVEVGLATKNINMFEIGS